MNHLESTGVHSRWKVQREKPHSSNNNLFAFLGVLDSGTRVLYGGVCTQVQLRFSKGRYTREAIKGESASGGNVAPSFSKSLFYKTSTFMLEFKFSIGI